MISLLRQLFRTLASAVVTAAALGGCATACSASSVKKCGACAAK